MAKTKEQKPASSQPQVIKRYIRYRDAQDAMRRLRTTKNGRRYVIRFSVGQRIEHFVLLLSFTMLAITGLVQTYYNTAIGSFILNLLGGIDATRQVHHLFAVLMIIQSVYHVGLFVYELFVYRRISKIWPEWKDITDVIEMLKLNLGMGRQHPRFDRYTFEEKAEYWALVWGTVVMVITGLMQWLPVLVTKYMPGWGIPVARAFHRWEAILAVLAILTWHFYHSVLKVRNMSIFTGIMSIEQMEEEHPIELAYLEKAAAAITSKTWPVLIEIPVAGDHEQSEDSQEQSTPAQPADGSPLEPAPDGGTN